MSELDKLCHNFEYLSNYDCWNVIKIHVCLIIHFQVSVPQSYFFRSPFAIKVCQWNLVQMNVLSDPFFF